MIPIERFYRIQLISEGLDELAGQIAIIETSLGDKHDDEINALIAAEEHLIEARKALTRAQQEARRGCQDELLSQQLTESVLRFQPRGQLTGRSS